MIPSFNKTIYLFNLLKAKDNPSKEDVWIKTVIPNCAWSEKVTRSTSGTEVQIGKSIICRIPLSGYVPYDEWITSNQKFTASTGDYISLVDSTEPQGAIIQVVKVNDFYEPHIRIEAV